jgi:cation transport ATPase
VSGGRLRVALVDLHAMASERFVGAVIADVRRRQRRRRSVAAVAIAVGVAVYVCPGDSIAVDVALVAGRASTDY